MINPKKQKNEKNRKRRPLNTSRRRFVTFLSPEIQLTNIHLLSVIVGLTFLCHARAHTSSVMLGLGVDSWRERAISEVRDLRDERGPTQLGIYTRTSTNTRHLLTICTQKATRFNKDSHRSRCCGQAGTACVIQDFQKTCNFCTRHPLYKLFKLRLEPLSPHNTHNFPE